MKEIDEQFISSDKALANNMKRLSSMTFDRSRTMREHIIEMRDIAGKYILQTQENKQSINELLNRPGQEEEMLKHDISENANLVTRDKKDSMKDKSVSMKKKDSLNKDICHFCRTKGH
ncbi:hypothetical protein CQW23_12389 [Capsicum baccatum]|uniref:Uncharacterized protein n=1 Tax=Capsicum baccatum TaxID=33114 RepID=A0A2G2WSL7_CAPBA|nr:hypothetical protein CQW23_12389 [Capsicum baccatum]